MVVLGLAAVVGAGAMDTTTIAISRVQDEPTTDSSEMVLAGNGAEQKLHVDRNVRLHDRDFADMELVEDPEIAIRITLTAEGVEKFSALTREALGQRLAIVADGRVLSAPVVREEITGNSIMITGALTKQEAAGLVALFKRAKEQR